jgi:hypothetical protein
MEKQRKMAGCNILPSHGHRMFVAGAVAITAGLLLLASCHKKNKEIAEDTGYASEQCVAEKTFNDVEDISVHASAVASGSLNYRTAAVTGSGCATVRRSGDSVIIDFGTTNCVCRDGRTRRGQVIVINYGKYTDSGSIREITFNNFYQNDNKVTGLKTVTNMGSNASGQPWYDVAIHGAVTLSGGGTIHADWKRVRTWMAGYSTPSDFTDDVYSISGSGSMTRANGAIVAINISSATPLIVAPACKWIEAGTITFTLAGGATRSLNYGATPVCDNKAELTLPGGKVISITKP